MNTDTDRSQTAKRSVQLARLTRIEGHVRGIARMVERDAEAAEVLDQIIAVTRALKALATDVAAAQIRDYLADAGQPTDAAGRTAF